jgi:agmatine/peptidylarginine deiminase
MISLMMRNYDYGHPAIHTESHIQNYARIPADQDVVLSGTFVTAYERNGHHYAVVDADLYALDGQHLARQRHTNIFKVRRAAERNP